MPCQAAVKVEFAPFSARAKGVLVLFCEEGLKFGSIASRLLEPTGDLVTRAAAGEQLQGQEWLGAGDRGAVRPRRDAARHRGARQEPRPRQPRFRQARRHGHGQASVSGEGCDRHRRSPGRTVQAGCSRRHRGGLATARLCVRALQDETQGRRGKSDGGQGHDCGRGGSGSGKDVCTTRRGGKRRAARARSRQRAGQRAVPWRSLPGVAET